VRGGLDIYLVAVLKKKKRCRKNILWESSQLLYIAYVEQKPI
jgi:hypothetical protein